MLSSLALVVTKLQTGKMLGKRTRGALFPPTIPFLKLNHVYSMALKPFGHRQANKLKANSHGFHGWWFQSKHKYWSCVKPSSFCHLVPMKHSRQMVPAAAKLTIVVVFFSSVICVKPSLEQSLHCYSSNWSTSNYGNTSSSWFLTRGICHSNSIVILLYWRQFRERHFGL